MLNGDNDILTAMYYDDNGRVVQSRSTNHLGGYNYNYFAYNFIGQPTTMRHEHKGVSATIIPEVYSYGYDHAGRPTFTLYSYNNAVADTLSKLSYNELGQMEQKALFNNGVQKINYLYNIRGWAKSISSNNFSEIISYQDAPAGATPCYNGNISAVSWNNSGIGGAYNYTYDGLNRLKTATDAVNGYYNEEVSQYDKNGNIQKMKRDCPVWIVEESAPGTEEMDNLEMYYNGNQLRVVYDEANTDNMKYADNGITLLFPENDFRDHAGDCDSYLYDKNGNQTADLNKKIAWIRYNSLNLPEKIQFMNGNTSEYNYDATGVKRSAYYLTSMDALEIPLGDVNQEFVDNGENVSETHQTDYCGNFIYESGTLCKVLTPEGYLAPVTYRYKPTATSPLIVKTEMMHNYFLRDHLGNTRVQLKQNKTSLGAIYFGVADINDYYAFGLEHGRPWEQVLGGYTSTTNPYLFNGKEMDRMHGLNQLDYGARWYDPSLGRWGGVMDPLAEKKSWLTPYHYCSNNPVNRIDPDGMDDVYNRQGEFIENNNHEIDKKKDHIVIRNQNYVKKALVSLGLGNTKMVKNMSDNIDTRIERTTLSAEAYSNVFTNILSGTKGVNMDNLYNGSVSVVVSHNDYNVDDEYNSPSTQSGQNASTGNVDGQTRITASIINSGDKYDNRFLFSTTSNVQNLLGAHEKIGHGQMGWGDATKTHHKVYEYQFNHNSWKNTNPAFKNYMKNVYDDYIYPTKK